MLQRMGACVSRFAGLDDTATRLLPSAIIAYHPFLWAVRWLDSHSGGVFSSPIEISCRGKSLGGLGAMYSGVREVSAMR